MSASIGPASSTALAILLTRDGHYEKAQADVIALSRGSAHRGLGDGEGRQLGHRPQGQASSNGVGGRERRWHTFLLLIYGFIFPKHRPGGNRLPPNVRCCLSNCIPLGSANERGNRSRLDRRFHLCSRRCCQWTLGYCRDSTITMRIIY